MLLTRNNLIYFGAALIVGAIFAFGIASITYQPVPLQVAENPYPAVTPPPLAIQTLAPQYIPGSTAETEVANPNGDPYAPAQAPVIVTTAPLPTITPTPTEDIGGARECTPVSQSWKSVQEIDSSASQAFALGGVVSVAIIAVDILMIIIGVFSGHGETSINVGSFNTTQNLVQNHVHSAIPSSGLIPFLIGIGGILVALYIGAIIVGSLTASLMCVP